MPSTGVILTPLHHATLRLLLETLHDYPNNGCQREILKFALFRLLLQEFRFQLGTVLKAFHHKNQGGTRSILLKNATHQWSFQFSYVMAVAWISDFFFLACPAGGGEGREFAEKMQEGRGEGYTSSPPPPPPSLYACYTGCPSQVAPKTSEILAITAAKLK